MQFCLKMLRDFLEDNSVFVNFPKFCRNVNLETILKPKTGVIHKLETAPRSTIVDSIHGTHLSKRGMHLSSFSKTWNPLNTLMYVRTKLVNS